MEEEEENLSTLVPPTMSDRWRWLWVWGESRIVETTDGRRDASIIVAANAAISNTASTEERRFGHTFGDGFSGAQRLVELDELLQQWMGLKHMFLITLRDERTDIWNQALMCQGCTAAVPPPTMTIVGGALNKCRDSLSLCFSTNQQKISCVSALCLCSFLVAAG